MTNARSREHDRRISHHVQSAGPNEMNRDLKVRIGISFNSNMRRALVGLRTLTNPRCGGPGFSLTDVVNAWPKCRQPNFELFPREKRDLNKELDCLQSCTV